MKNMIRVYFAAGGFALAKSIGLNPIDNGLAVFSIEFEAKEIVNKFVDKLAHNGLWFHVEKFN